MRTLEFLVKDLPSLWPVIDFSTLRSFLQKAQKISRKYQYVGKYK